MPTVDCDRYSCKYNDAGFCNADIIYVNFAGCETYEDFTETMDDIERSEYMQEVIE